MYYCVFTRQAEGQRPSEELIEVEADLTLSPSHDESCHVTPLICNILLRDRLPRMHISCTYVLMRVQPVLLLLL